jgi:hypothetical protein
MTLRPENIGVRSAAAPARAASAGTLRNPDPSRAKPIKWAWQARIPAGRPSLLVGNEGCGKGTLIAHLAASWSRGTLPGDLAGTPANVLIVGDEDALDDVWTPRLYAAGADWGRIWFPPEDATDVDFTSPADVERLRRWVRDRDARIVVFDALLDHLGGASVDEFKPKAVRNALRPLRRLAADEGFAALGAMHPRKGNALTFRDLVANSHQFNAVSRSSLLLATHPEDECRRVLVRAKGNHAAPPPVLEFRISGHVFELNGHVFDEPHAVDWRESTVKLEALLPKGAGRPRNEDARGRVAAALGSEPLSVRKLADATGVSKSTVQDILTELSGGGDAAKPRKAGCPQGVRKSRVPEFPDTRTATAGGLTARTRTRPTGGWTDDRPAPDRGAARRTLAGPEVARVPAHPRRRDPLRQAGPLLPLSPRCDRGVGARRCWRCGRRVAWRPQRIGPADAQTPPGPDQEE